MLFNSPLYLFAFLPIAFFIYFALVKARLTVASKTWLVLVSLFFYSYWKLVYLPLILTSMLVNFAIGSGLSQQTTREVPSKIQTKHILILGVIFNLGLLGYFKYADFFVENLNLALGVGIPLPNVILPLAISFFTFQQVAYLVDSYRGKTLEYDFLNYALFVTFFPQLIAGPIVHHAEMMPQFASRRNLFKCARNIYLGLVIIGLGLFKKVVIADTFAVLADTGFDQAETLNFIEAWVTSLAYTFQLYFDFSGYTDMAIGAALLFNIRLPINFNSPYKATDIQDFWRRWHMTLSRFLRDYLYIALGGNRNGSFRTYINLFATFLIGGLWHGAGWMFVIWGALHGLAVVVHRAWKEFGLKMPMLLGWLITFNFVNFAWVFFRAKDIESAAKVVRGMVGLGGVELPSWLHYWRLEAMGVSYGSWLSELAGGWWVFPQLLAAFVLVLKFKNSSTWLDLTEPGYRLLLVVGVLAGFAITMDFYSSTAVFLYFNF